jgi:hypothetical protein
MPKCVKCFEILPPDFLDDVSATDKICIFCSRNIKEIKYGKDNNKITTKKEIIEEYKIFLKMVKEKNQILKDFTKGKTGEVPEKIRPV